MNLDEARARMVRDQLIARGITNGRLLEAMGELPRELFVSSPLREQAYEDGPLPIGNEQTISQPYVVALMTQCLELKGDETVLEVGAGSGYQTAILAKLARRVYSVEKYSGLAGAAREVLGNLEIENVEITVGDGSVGWVEHAPYDGIIVTAAAPAMPAPLLSQLRARGRIVIPIGSRYDQYLEVWQRRGDAWHIEKSLPVRFVPLVGEWGWGS
ncbi:MAG: protein-L-isoaspartate(D-aspartate) O-methyltransferase [Chloroflexota bacterium]